MSPALLSTPDPAPHVPPSAPLTPLLTSLPPQVLAERSYGSSSGRQVAVMSPGAALRPGLAVEGDVAWLTEPGVMNVMTCRHHIIGEYVRWWLG